MGRKKSCPKCHTKKLVRIGNQWKCKVCGHEFGKQKGRTSKKEKKGW